ncbi:MAG TPA: ISAzo13 family transposase [Gemmataceae bacterium]|nr:ISAzo13 family transposase [Gemmataceae bacterium]
MPTNIPHTCQCPTCLGKTGHPDKEYHRQVNAFLATLNRQQRRLYAAVESNRLGRGGDQVMAQVTGMCASTIRAGRRQLADQLKGKPPRKPIWRAGRPRTEKKHPGIIAALEAMLADEIAGDPMNGKIWVRSSLSRLAGQLREQGFSVDRKTVWRILKRLGLSLKFNAKRRKGFGYSTHPERDEQFKYIASKRKEFTDAGLPVISVDTKKKELIGDFRNPGRTWCRHAPEVNEHDFPSAAECRAVPFGVYDLAKNQGYVVVGVSHDTPEFAVKVISRWWREDGRAAYPRAKQLLILVDGGGTNGCRSKAWKFNLQQELCDGQGLIVTVCHYPRGCSKWNPIERRLFSQIGINWAGKPLRSLRIMLGYIRGATTTTGLRVKAYLDEDTYRKGQKASRDEMDRLNLKRHAVCPERNYTRRGESCHV